jgi:hypothetical protein
MDSWDANVARSTRRDSLIVWFLNRIPRRVIYWCLVRAAGEWEVENGTEFWQKDGAVAMGSVVDWWFWRAYPNTVPEERSGNLVRDIPVDANISGTLRTAALGYPDYTGEDN